MFNVDTQVSHPGLGACKITGIYELNLTGEKIQYYKLVPYHGASETMYIPTANADRIGVRKLVSKEGACFLMGSLNSAEEPWLSDSMAKQKRYRALFADNTEERMQEMMATMSALVKQKQKKELGSVDKTMLESIQKKLMSELAVALDISLKEAIQCAENLILHPTS